MRLMIILGLILLVACEEGHAQSFTFVAVDTLMSAPVGSEIVFDCTIRNTSTNALTLRIIRTMNNLPQNWESAMCVTACYPPEVDTIITPQVNPGDTLPFSMHIYTLTNPGTGIVRVISSNAHDPADQRVLTFTGNGIPTGVHTTTNAPNEFSLLQNYPNPFNPGTTIEFKTTASGFVSLKVFDLAGREVATLVYGELVPGTHRVTLDGWTLSSGVYICRLQMNDRLAARKLTLIK